MLRARKKEEGSHPTSVGCAERRRGRALDRFGKRATKPFECQDQGTKFKEVCQQLIQTKQDFKRVRERGAQEAEAEGDFVEGLILLEFAKGLAFLVRLELGGMGVCNSIFQRVEPNKEALSFFARLPSTKIRMTAAYFGWCSA